MIEKKFAVLILIILVVPLAAAHEENLDDGVKLKARAMSVIIVSSILVTALVILAIISKEKFHNHKKMLFSLMVIPIIVATVYAAGTTIYLNQVSLTKGPVHWHADFEIWNCGTKINLLDSSGLSNRVGTPVFHEHNDFRIHVEGVVVKEEDVALGNFVSAIGGSLTEDGLTIPADEGTLFLQNGEKCSENSEAGKIQVFVYKVMNPEETGNWVYAQEKVENYTDYILSPFPQIPPGDCIIIEFDQDKAQTDKICASYAAAIQSGELHGR